MQPYTPVDATGDGAAHTIASITGIDRCRWFQVTGVAVASTAGRVGDANVSSSRGFPISSGGGQFAPPVSMITEDYDLTKWYVLFAASDTFSVGVCV